MPNHVDNDLYISGPAEDIERFIKFAEKDDYILSADVFVPYPEEFRKLDEAAQKAKEQANLAGEDWSKVPKDGYNQGGYEWCLANWGTKWGLYNAAITKRGPRSVKYQFQSAWSPPVPVIEAMSKKFPSLDFKLHFFECGMAFKGFTKHKEGKLYEFKRSSYHGHRGG